MIGKSHIERIKDKFYGTFYAVSRRCDKQCLTMIFWYHSMLNFQIMPILFLIAPLQVRNIKNNPVINTVVETTKLAKMENEIQV